METDGIFTEAAARTVIEYRKIAVFLRRQLGTNSINPRHLGFAQISEIACLCMQVKRNKLGILFM